jgi:hypothetical protein
VGSRTRISSADAEIIDPLTVNPPPSSFRRWNDVLPPGKTCDVREGKLLVIFNICREHCPTVVPMIQTSSPCTD